MLKTILVGAMIVFAAGAAAPTANAGPYCATLGSNPTIDDAKQAVLDAVLADDGDGIANDIIDNCPQYYDIIMRGGDQLIAQLGG